MMPMNEQTLSLQHLATTAQGTLLAPEDFQQTLINAIGSALQRPNRPPCLLRAPTGSGKTFMLTQVLAHVSSQAPVVWFWFVPFVNLVAQTLDAIKTNTPALTPVTLTLGRNQDPAAAQVLIATTQSVARAQWRSKGYNADGDDDTRTVAQWVSLARARQLKIGMVVDEAHIALDKGTEFGKFAQWLEADYLLLATATPKDARLNQFLESAGKEAVESFAVSRDDVVKARLNKRYIETVIYELGPSLQNIADLQRTVLRQAWLRHQFIRQALANAGVALTPLLLVQVANGDKTVEEAEQILMQLCHVHPEKIAKHSADAPDPVMMAALAANQSKEVLIFKQSAGTGFDAPRAFVLASTKLVSDADFATQFIGRVMRVAQQVRQTFPDRQLALPVDLDTACVYLADARDQRGFAVAVHGMGQLKSELEGQTEKLVIRQTASGATIITNRTTPQAPLTYDSSQQQTNQPTTPATSATPATPATSGPQQDMFDDSDSGAQLDVYQPASQLAAAQAKPAAPRTQAELVSHLASHEIRLYPKRADLPNVPQALQAERKPPVYKLDAMVKTVAARLDIPTALSDTAIRAARDQLKDKERRTELTTDKTHTAEVRIVTDRNALAREAQLLLLRGLPQAEQEDVRLIIQVLTERLRPQVVAKLEEADTPLDETATTRIARDAAHWVAKQRVSELAEAMHAEIAKMAESYTAQPLPDAMLFAAELPLAKADRNLYGVFPPAKENMAELDKMMLLENRQLLRQGEWALDVPLRTAAYDHTLAMNKLEMDFAQALDRSSFVRWWHRNPEGKPYSVRLVRGEHKNHFYPDFVICLEHYPGDEPLIRLIETKQDTKDAARKAKHTPAFYGKVLFLTQDGSTLKWINNDGTLGDVVDLDQNMPAVQAWLLKTRPQQEN